MTKFKVCSKIHLFIIISALLIAIGMAVGTVCHFIANGFFNYGGEFSSYKSVTVTYYSSEYTEETIKPVCEDALGEFGAYEVSYADARLGGEIVYKFSSSADSAKLQSAVDKLNTALDKNNSGLNVASLHEGEVKEGGAKALIFASIAVASAAALQFIYFVIRYKLRAAYSALLANVHNLGLFVALAALTRIPVGSELVAFGAVAVVLTMIATCVLFDRTRKNFKNEKYAKVERKEVIETSAAEVSKVTLTAICALAVATVVIGALAAIAQMWIGALAPYGVALLALLACGYGVLLFTPAVHGAIDGACEKAKASLKSSKTDKTKKAKPAEPVKDKA